MGKIKKLCKWKKEELREDIKKYKKLVKESTHLCEKCGRTAKDDELLCKPTKL